MTREDIIREADAWLKMNGLTSDEQTCFRMALFAQHIAALAAEHGAKQERDRHTAVMRQALEALETVVSGLDRHTHHIAMSDPKYPLLPTITALREALKEDKT